MNKANPPALDIDLIVADILSAMSLKEKSIIANMDEESLPYLQYAFDVYIYRSIGDDEEEGKKIMKRVWKALRRSHRIRIVRQDEKE